MLLGNPFFEFLDLSVKFRMIGSMRFRKKRERIAFSQQLLEFLRYYAHTRPPPINIHKIPAESNLTSTCLSSLGVPRWRGSGCRGIARPFYKQEQGRRASVQLRLLTVTESEPFGLPSLTRKLKSSSFSSFFSLIWEGKNWLACLFDNSIVYDYTQPLPDVQQK